jgi:hypothetical protein
MGQIDLQRMTGRTRHTVVVKLPFEDDKGNVTTEELRVVYRGVSLNEGAEIQARAEAESDARAALVNALSEVVIALPDVVNDGQPVAPDADFFRQLDTFFLNRINAAIQEDRQGPNA